MKEENNNDNRHGKKNSKKEIFKTDYTQNLFFWKKIHKFYRYPARLIRKNREKTQLPITEIKVVASLHVPQILK